MNICTAEVKDNCLVIGDVVHLMIETGGHSDVLLAEIAKRWNAYMEMIRFLERAELVFNCAILRTPTGDLRNDCTDRNIERMQFLAEAEGKKVKEKKSEGP